MASDPLRDLLNTNGPHLMAWVGLGVPVVVEAMGAAGYDLVLVDQQHGPTGKVEMVNCLVAARAAGLPAVVRPLTADAGLIGAALDAGAQGVVCPLVETQADVEACVRAAHYAPVGMRSSGPYRASFLVEGDYTERSRDLTFVAVQIETQGAMDNLDDILATDGLDMVLVGPNDLALALTGERSIAAPAVMEACDEILKKAREASVYTAIFANTIDYARPFYEAGWDVISVRTDLGTLTRAAADTVAALKG